MAKYRQIVLKKYQSCLRIIASPAIQSVLNTIWLLLEISRNIFLVTLQNCKHHTGQPTERHLPRESA